MRIRGLVVMAMLAAGAQTVRAEGVVVLKTGHRVTGVVVGEDAEGLDLRVNGRVLRVPRRAVGSIVRGGTAPSAPDAAPAPEKAPAPKREGAARETEAASAPRPDLALIKSMDGPGAADAVQTLAAQWPASESTLDAALVHASPAVRRVAVAALGQLEIGPVAKRIIRACGDPDATVRLLAVRMVRTRKVGDAEALLVGLLRGDSAMAVRLEALRSLEDVGTAACLDAVLEHCRSASDANVRRRYLRVLRKHTGEDHGADDQAWSEVVRRAKAAASAPEPAR